MKIYQVYLAETMYEQARAKADALGLSFAAYVRMLVAKDLTQWFSFPLINLRGRPKGKGLSL